MSSSFEPAESFTRPRDNVLALSLVQVLRLGTAFVVGVVVARSMGPEAFGRYAFLTTVLHVLGFAANAGIHQWLPREVARRPDVAASLVATALSATHRASVVAAGLVLAYVGWRDPTLVAAAAVAAVSLAAEAHNNVFLAGLEGLRDVRPQVPAVAIGRAGHFVGALAALRAELGAAGLFAAQSVALAVTGAWLRRGFVARVGALPPPGPTRPLFTAAAPFAAYVLLSSLSERVDVLFLQALRTDAEVGVYRGATVLWMQVPVVAQILATAMLPALAARPDDRAASVRWSVERLLLLGACAGAWVARVGPDVVAFVLGPEYADADVVRVIAVALPIVFVRSAVGAALVAGGEDRARALGMLVAAAVNVAGNAVWVPRWGGVGAAAAWATSEVALLGVWIARAPSRPSAGAVLRALLPAAGMVGVGFAVESTALAGVVELCVGAALAVGTGGLRRDDLRRLRRL
jgi:O-antigen/teichoic acid export membrane protein